MHEHMQYANPKMRNPLVYGLKHRSMLVGREFIFF